MDTKEIQRLLDYIAKSPLAEVSIETEGLKVSVKKHGEAAPVVSVVSAAPAAAPVAAAPADDTSKYITVKSPMIGTYYSKPSPDKPVFVKEGDVVKVGTVLCVVEAMKLFNEIESEVSGKIVKILLSDKTPIEYDQPMFLIDPNV